MPENHTRVASRLFFRDDYLVLPNLGDMPRDVFMYAKLREGCFESNAVIVRAFT